MKIIIFCCLFLLFLSPKSLAAEHISTSKFSKEDKYRYTNYSVAGGVIFYGILKWNYFQNGLSTGNEGWFSRNTKSGGADKLGHAYTSYLTAMMANHIYLDWGFEKEEAARKSVITSFILSTTMELGDASSQDYGFSYEDFISNSAGQALAYFLATNEKAAKFFDFRLEYNPTGGVASDIVTDYESMKYVGVLKFSGFENLQNSYLKYLEFHLGYYTRNYEGSRVRNDHNRNLYFGIGINLAQILDDLGHKKTAKIFNYYQMPYTYVEAVRFRD